MIPSGATAIVICQRALADVGTRSTITSLGDGSTEANLCSLYYNGILLHLLRAANWNFATRTDLLTLWKALPGTPENPTPATQSGWSPAYPAPPWTYSYVYPQDCVRARKLIGQPQQVPIAPPIFSGSQGTSPPISQRLPMARFEVSTDLYDASGLPIFGLNNGFPPAIANGGTNYFPGETVVLEGGALLTHGAAYAPFAGWPAGVRVSSVGPGGTVTAIDVLDPGTYITTPLNITQDIAIGSGTGLVLATQAIRPNSYGSWVAKGVPVISTNQEFALLEYTYWDSTTESTMDPLFEEAFVSALAARLSQPLTGDKALARDKFNLANNIIINARTTDANEGLTINDHIPDWIRVRGVGGALGYEMFFYPLGPLFPVAPLV